MLASRARVALLVALLGAITVLISLIPPVSSWGRGDPGVETSPPSELPDGVTTYDIGGDEGPEFVSIEDEVFAVPRDTRDPWWVTALNPGSTLGAALVAAGAVWYQTTKARADLERRLAELEARSAPPATAQ
jgi:hypothetical protein